MTKEKVSYYDHLKVRVTYSDGKGEHQTTVGELKEKFKDESPEWLKKFLLELVGDGEAFTRFGGKYELIED